MVRYSESLTPTAPVHLALLVLIPMGFGMIAPITITGGYISAAVCYLLALSVLVLQAPKVVVTDDTFRAGRATIERTHIAGATVIERDGRNDAISDARTWKVIRAWIPRGVLVEINDPEDPTPSWYVSSRQPEKLVAALTRAN